MKPRFAKRGDARLHRITLRSLKRERGSHERWIRLGEFAAAHGRDFDPAVDNQIGHLTRVAFYLNPVLQLCRVGKA